MQKSVEKISVSGGWIARDAKTGRFVSVSIGEKVQKERPRTASTVKEVSKRRSSALRRLADR